MEEIELLEEQENKDYLAKLLEVLKESTKENSIIVEFNLEISRSSYKVNQYNLDGSIKEYEEKLILTKEEIIEKVIKTFLKELLKNRKILINNISSYKENTSSLKIISEDNNMCKINGLDNTNATYLSELVEKKMEQSINQAKIDERGVGNALGFILSIVLFATIIMLMIFTNNFK